MTIHHLPTRGCFGRLPPPHKENIYYLYAINIILCTIWFRFIQNMFSYGNILQVFYVINMKIDDNTDVVWSPTCFVYKYKIKTSPRKNPGNAPDRRRHENHVNNDGERTQYNTNQSVKNPRRRYDQGHVHDHVYGRRGVYGEVWHAVELHRDVWYDAVLYPVHGVGHGVQHVHDQNYPSGLVQPQVVLLEAHHPGVGRQLLVHFLHNRSKIGHRFTCVWLTARRIASTRTGTDIIRDCGGIVSRSGPRIIVLNGRNHGR